MGEKLLPEERKLQIIQTAMKLFKEKGYENTSVNNIIDEVGISKGGFYHHYGSKEELLKDVAELFIGEMEVIFEQINNQDGLSALEKTNEYIRRINAYKKDKMIEVAVFLTEFYSDGKNIQLENMIFDYAKKRIAPIMKDIIVQGIEEGEFKTDFPEEAAEVYVKLFVIHQKEMAELFYKAMKESSKEKLDIIMRKYKFIQKVIEDMLGLEKGALVLEEVAASVIEAFWKDHIELFPRK